MIRKDLLNRVGLTALKVGALATGIGILRSWDSTISLSESLFSGHGAIFNITFGALTYVVDRFVNRKRNSNEELSIE